MLMRQNTLPAYNVQTAVDAEHSLIVAQTVVLDAADSRCLQPMAEAARMALGIDNFQIVADAGYSSQVSIARERGAFAPASVAKTRLPLPSRCQYLFAIQAADFFECRRFAHRQSECQRTISAFRNAEDAAM